ncbi:hypothetical protein ABG067_006826 [Albugo candida]|uniref:Uncharacterized protein n=1 Tax=Albugo candida TaxID=65357 RepID=A0A024G3L6_9STRA|nr:unnamed protein product [Albugo candida]|eukprot:CCI41423.1 unnamed protein product [Albugo candida]
MMIDSDSSRVLDDVSQNYMQSNLLYLPCGALKALTNIERVIIRAFAFIMYRIAENHARYCVKTIQHYYGNLHRHLYPSKAADSLERLRNSFVSLSDQKFTTFWVALMDKSMEHGQWAECSQKGSPHTSSDNIEATHDASFVKRTYRQLIHVVNRILPGCRAKSQKCRMCVTQTPLTSPDDRFEFIDMMHQLGVYVADSGQRNETIEYVELGWAVEYLEQESSCLPDSMTQKMRQMMHSSIPLNLFRVAVDYGCKRDDEATLGLLGSVTPDSLPPTPITRALQATRMNRYTVSVLDHANLALQMMQAN